MPAETPTSPRRRWHLRRWFIVLMVGTLGWVGWTAYAYRAALSQAKALGWEVEHTDPVERIRKNWKSAFEKETWRDGVTYLIIPTSQEFEQHLDIVHRLDPRGLRIDDASTLRDLSALIPLKRLKNVAVGNATSLTNVGALKNLPALQLVNLAGCTGLTAESIKALKAALPKAQIFDP